MDIRQKIALETVNTNLGFIVRFAEANGLPPDVVLATFLDCGASIYAEGVVTAGGRKERTERKAARKLFHRAVVRMMSDLPSAAKDAQLEDRLAKGGFHDQRPG